MKSLRQTRPVICAIGAYVLAGLATSAYAQHSGAPIASPGQASEDDARDSAPEDIVVTARRSSERLQDVPVAVTAITEAQLAATQPRTLQDLTTAAPNVNIGPSGGGASAAAIFIRGLGYSDIEKGQAPSVGLLIDDVVIGPNTGQLIDAFDIDQVEINRGPQGIFQGRNTIGGSVSVRRSRPTKEWGLRASVGAGSFGQIVGKAIANAPLGESAGIKIGASHRRNHGYLENVYTGDDHVGGDKMTTGTLALSWEATPDLNILATADYVRQNGDGTPNQFGSVLAGQLLGGIGLTFNEIGVPYIPGVTQPLTKYQVATDFPTSFRMTQHRYSLQLDWKTPIGDLASITAYLDQKDRFVHDGDSSCGSDLQGLGCNILGNPFLPVLHFDRPQDYWQFSQEARLTNDFGPAKVMIGMYYAKSENKATQLTANLIPGVPVDQYQTGQFSTEKNDSISGFANIDANVSDQLQVSMGARYLHEKKDFQNRFATIYGAAGPVDTTLVVFGGSKSWNALLTRLSATYKVTPNNVFYVSRSEGFRSGGFSPRGSLSEQDPSQNNYSPGANYSTFEPETNVSYEIGYKGVLLDRQLTLNLAAFSGVLKDHQIVSFVVAPNYGPGSNTYVINVPKIRNKGIEAEATLRPRAIDGLSLQGQFSYLDAKVTDGRIPGALFGIGPGGQAGTPGSTADITGDPLERAPKYTYGVRADYTVPIGPGEAGFNLGYKWQSRYVVSTGTLLGQYDYQSSYGMLDGSISYSWNRYKLIVSGKNLTNKAYRSYSLPSVFYQGWAEPRSFFVEFQARF